MTAKAASSDNVRSITTDGSVWEKVCKTVETGNILRKVLDNITALWYNVITKQKGDYIMPAKGYRKADKKDRVFQLRLTEEEFKKAEYLADCFNKSVAQYIRDIIDSRYEEARNKKIEVLITE